MQSTCWTLRLTLNGYYYFIYKKVWILGGWGVSETALLRVYQAIDRIDWKCDIVLAYNRAHHPHPDFLRFFSDRQRIQMPFPLLDRYAIDVSMALKMEIKYVLRILPPKMRNQMITIFYFNLSSVYLMTSMSKVWNNATPHSSLKPGRTSTSPHCKTCLKRSFTCPPLEFFSNPTINLWPG